MSENGEIREVQVKRLQGADRAERNDNYTLTLPINETIRLRLEMDEATLRAMIGALLQLEHEGNAIGSRHAVAGPGFYYVEKEAER